MNISNMVPLKWLGVLVSIIFLIVSIGCGSEQQKKNERNSMAPSRSIDSVKEAHTSEFMNIPGVVGVYVGETDDGILYIGVMVKKTTPELERQIPSTLEGYPVHVEETGEIKPLH